MTVHHVIQDQFKQMEWADACVWRAVQSAESALADDMIRQRLHHLHAVQRAFLAMWRDEPFEFGTGASLRGADLMAWGRDYHHAVRPVLAAWSDAELERPIVVPWVPWVRQRIGKEPMAPTLCETAFQVVGHTTHHRGQVTAALRTLGSEPPLVDFIAWVWLGKPDAEW